jgi:hypothetical protein
MSRTKNHFPLLHKEQKENFHDLHHPGVGHKQNQATNFVHFTPSRTKKGELP